MLLLAIRVVFCVIVPPKVSSPELVPKPEPGGEPPDTGLIVKYDSIASQMDTALLGKSTGDTVLLDTLVFRGIYNLVRIDLLIIILYSILYSAVECFNPFFLIS